MIRLNPSTKYESGTGYGEDEHSCEDEHIGVGNDTYFFYCSIVPLRTQDC